jgi:hypothetical protein
MSLKNPNRISIRELTELYGFDDEITMAEEYAMESVVPACCKEGCEVEPDGYCPHKCPSLLIELGII